MYLCVIKSLVSPALIVMAQRLWHVNDKDEEEGLGVMG